MVKYQKMNAAFKKVWLKALRSGKYYQGQDQLYCKGDTFIKGKELENVDLFCCLGVAYHCVAGRKPSSSYKLVDLNNSMLKRIGLTNEIQQKLAERNDTGWSFNKIANWIEKNL